MALEEAPSARRRVGVLADVDSPPPEDCHVMMADDIREFFEAREDGSGP